MKTILLILFCIVGVSAYGQVPIDLHQKQATTTADSTHITLVSDPSTGYPYKSTIGTLFKNHTGYIYYKTSNAEEADIPQGTWKIFKNTVTDSVFLYINDSTTIYKVILSKVE